MLRRWLECIIVTTAPSERSPRFGLHIGLQDTTPAEVLELARAAEEQGFDWVSVWDHFVSVSPVDGGSLESVAMHSAVASATSRVRCGVLVYRAAYRHPGVLAHAAATIDLISGGRAEIGLGAGWSEREYTAFGLRYGRPGERLDLLEEAVQCVRLLLHEERADFDGRFFQLAGAATRPRPHQRAVPIWIGGAGERRTLPIVARYADGWNAPFLSAPDFARKHLLLEELWASEGRSGAVRSAANIGYAADDAALAQHHGTLTPGSHPGLLRGHGAELAEGLAAYAAAGADQINIAVRAPFDRRALDVLTEASTTATP